MTAGDQHPTDAELEVLTVLWDRGPSTVRAVYDALETGAPTRRYTTVLKIMQVMADKGLLVRDESRRAHVYEPTISRDSERSRLVDELAEKAFGGSALSLALQALSSRQATTAELDRVRELLREMEEDAE
jgi:predicted transcriptional regulator